ncbi:MAG: hypothetical protein KF845_00170 [Cyclobacteriaceae bacterium]|nr:hypothetical protein [Cyclobacteriaceae bacterium]
MTNKGKIVYLLSMMAMVFIVLGYISITQLKKSEITRITDETIESIHTTSLDLFKNDVDFFNRELHKPEYYQTGKSIYLDRHDRLIGQLHNLIEEATQTENINIDNDLLEIDSIAQRYDKAFKDLSAKITEKGFYKFGLEGKLLKAGEELEDEKLVDPEELMLLEKHEKNYLLRGDSASILALHTLANRLIEKYKTHSAKKQGIENYVNAFNDFVAVSNEIGFSKQTGLKNELNNRTDELLEAIGSLSTKAEEYTIRAFARGHNMFMIAIITAVTFCFVLIILIARKL